MLRQMSLSRALMVSVVGLTMVAGTAAQAQPAAKQPEGERPAGPRGPAGEGREGRTPSLGSSMKAMYRAFSALSTQVGDASKKEENLALVGEIQRACINAKANKPGGKVYKNAKTDAEKATLTLQFRTHLITLAHALLELETQILEGKTDDAKATLGKLGKLQEEGHKLLGVGDDEDDKKSDKGEHDKGEKDKAHAPK